MTATLTAPTATRGLVEITGVLISFSLHRTDLLSRLWLL